ncbi:MAG: MFS transporter [Hungatella sp.]|jgi:predicted MFS family arabinose efflux permease|nr:MFS transporter [Hungatella sp.]
MTELFNKAGSFIAEKKIKKIDIICMVIAIFCLFFIRQNCYRYDWKINRQMSLESPWLVKADKQGNYYVVDNEKNRILKIADGQVEQSIHGNAPSGDTFYCAENISIADNGNIFVQDTGWNETGFSLKYESILQYDARGKFVEVCYRIDYDDIYCDKHRLFGMTVKGEILYFVEADEQGFSLKEINLPDKKLTEVFTYEMADAINLIHDFVIDTEHLDVYAIGKRGEIYRTSGGRGVLSVLYRLNEDPTVLAGQKSALYRGAVGRGGTVYVTDIASDQLLRFSEDNGYQREVVLEGSQMWNASCQELENGRELLTYVADGGICSADTDGTGAAGISKYIKSFKYGMKEVLFDLTAAVFFLAMSCLLLRILFIVFTVSYTNIQKIGALVISTVIAVSVILVYGLMGQFKDIYRDELLKKLSMTAQIVSNGIDKEQLDDIEMPQNYMNESYRKLWNTLDAVLDKEYAYSKDTYCNILRYDGTLGYALLYLDNSIGTFYPLTDDETKAVKEVYEQGISLQSDIQNETGSYIYVMMPVMGKDHKVDGVVSVGTLSSVIDGKIQKMSEDIVVAILMIILAIMFLFSEVFSFFDLKDKYREAAAGGAAAPIPMHVVRLTVFITFMAFNMATSFLPVYVMGFVREGMGIPTALANSLPITVNLVFIGLTSVFCPKMIEKLGFAKLAAFSGAAALCGDLFMACSRNYGMILLGLSLNGIGVGLITNSIQIFIASISKNQENEEGFSIFNASSISGINCGMLFGSTLAAHLGQNRVFFISAMAWVLVIIVFLMAGGRFITAGSSRSGEKQKKQSMPAFIVSPGILKFIICIQLPYIVMNSFTYYYVPVYGSEHNLTEKVVSLLIIACSLCSVYLSVAVTGYLSQKLKDKAMYLSSAITFAGLLFFAWKMSLPSLLAALLLIGLANSFGSSTRISRFLKMEESVRYGEEHAMGAYNFVDNLGESTGSIIFAGIISIGFGSGILGLIGCTGGLNAVYALTDRKAKKNTGIS